jgi:hypothetical protein
MISQSERKKMLKIPLCGEDMIVRLESIGISELADLQGKNPKEMMEKINDKAGFLVLAGPVPFMALTNLIDEANKKQY